MQWKSFFSQKPILPPTILPAQPVHIHEWENKLSTFAPPARGTKELNLVSPELLTKILMGITTFIDECVVCHAYRTTQVLGSQNAQLDDILDKVVEYGPQFVQRDGITFVLQRYTPVGQVTNAVPIR